MSLVTWVWPISIGRDGSTRRWAGRLTPVRRTSSSSRPAASSSRSGVGPSWPRTPRSSTPGAGAASRSPRTSVRSRRSTRCWPPPSGRRHHRSSRGDHLLGWLLGDLRRPRRPPVGGRPQPRVDDHRRRPHAARRRVAGVGEGRPLGRRSDGDGAQRWDDYPSVGEHLGGRPGGVGGNGRGRSGHGRGDPRGVRGTSAARPAVDRGRRDPASRSRTQLAAGGGIYATVDGAPAGSILLHPAPDRPGLVTWHRVSVHPAFQRHGIATAMVDAALDHAAELGFVSVELFAREEIAELIAFWQHRGFAVDRPAPNGVILARSLPVVVDVPTADQMQDLGARLAELLRPGDLVIASGDLGAGKTTLTQGIGRGLDSEGCGDLTDLRPVPGPCLAYGQTDSGARRRLSTHLRRGARRPRPRRDGRRCGHRRRVGRRSGRGAGRPPAGDRHPPLGASRPEAASTPTAGWCSSARWDSGGPTSTSGCCGRSVVPCLSSMVAAVPCSASTPPPWSASDSPWTVGRVASGQVDDRMAHVEQLTPLIRRVCADAGIAPDRADRRGGRTRTGSVHRAAGRASSPPGSWPRSPAPGCTASARWT